MELLYEYIVRFIYDLDYLIKKKYLEVTFSDET